MSKRISVVICTHNRAAYLRGAIKSLLNQTLNKDKFEILIVDNASTDGTKEMVLKEFSRLPNLRYIYEPVLGANQARNTGWINAQGEYVAFIDDDAIASSAWLEKIIEVFETINPKPGCIGGRVDLSWDSPRPPWLSNEIVFFLSCLDFSDTPVVMDEKHYLVGTNLAVPRRLLRAMGGFPVNLGRKGRKLLSMDEILLQDKLKKEGYACFYHPEIIVQHRILDGRLSQKWFLSRMFWEGVSQAVYESNQKPSSTAKRLRQGIRKALGILFSPRELANLAIPTNNPRRFAIKCETLPKIGYALALSGIVQTNKQ